MAFRPSRRAWDRPPCAFVWPARRVVTPLSLSRSALSAADAFRCFDVVVRSPDRADDSNALMAPACRAFRETVRRFDPVAVVRAFPSVRLSDESFAAELREAEAADADTVEVFLAAACFAAGFVAGAALARDWPVMPARCASM